MVFVCADIWSKYSACLFCGGPKCHCLVVAWSVGLCTTSLLEGGVKLIKISWPWTHRTLVDVAKMASIPESGFDKKDELHGMAGRAI